MASLCRNLRRFSRLGATLATKRTFYSGPVGGLASSNLGDSKDLGTPLSQTDPKLASIQKWEGNIVDDQSDPYDLDIQTIKPDSTIDNPNMVRSWENCRIIGCVCDEDTLIVSWTMLYKGEVKRCQCGHWFKLQLEDNEAPAAGQH